MLNFDVYYGKCEEPNWRGKKDDEARDNDAPLEKTPASVVDLLGFDPLDADREKIDARGEDGHGPIRRIHGLECVVETPKGGTRRGDGWTVTMPADYGYIIGYPGADGDLLDCYLGPNPESDAVYVVDQMRMDKPRKFDEHKAMLGFNTRNQALDAYMAGHHKSARIFGAMTPMTLNGFRDWLHTADLREPCSSKVRH